MSCGASDSCDGIIEHHFGLPITVEISEVSCSCAPKMEKSLTTPRKISLPAHSAR